MSSNTKLNVVIAFLIGVIIGGFIYFVADQLTPVQVAPEFIEGGVIKVPKVPKIPKATTAPKVTTTIAPKAGVPSGSTSGVAIGQPADD